jgi:glycosyltransferase involved in cell wall biosynthesis
MVQLSVVIITYNEQRNIKRCLNSVQKVADEIVVVDSYSEDKTPKICKEKGIRFIQHPFEGHIQQKNWASQQASYHYVLSLDADEALDEELTQSILSVKQNWQHDAYAMNRLTNYCGKWIHHSGWYPDTKLRLWDRRKGKWGGYNPHDEWQLHNPDKSTIKHLRGNILHYSFYSISEHVRQSNYFSDIAAEAYLKNGKKSSWRNILLNPVFKFLKSYLLKRGILDGFCGLIIAMISAHATFLKYVKLKQLQSEQ